MKVIILLVMASMLFLCACKWTSVKSYQCMVDGDMLAARYIDKDFGTVTIEQIHSCSISYTSSLFRKSYVPTNGEGYKALNACREYLTKSRKRKNVQKDEWNLMGGESE